MTNVRNHVSRPAHEATMRSSVPQRSTRRAGVVALQVGFLSSLFALIAGCSSGSASAVASGKGGNNGGGGGSTAVSCDKDAPGCSCSHEGAIIKCGVQDETDSGAGTVSCNLGGQICSQGKWSECLTNASDPSFKASGGLTLNGEKLVTGVQIKNISPGQACSGTPCDPYCHQYPDTAQGVDAGDGGVTVTDAGPDSTLTIITAGSPDGAAPPVALLKDAGLADGEGVTFLYLPTGTTKSSSFTTPQITVNSADIYFLVDDTSGMGPAAGQLASQLTNSTNGIIATIRSQIPTAYFGVGRFEDYYQNPYGPATPTQQSSSNPYDLPYQHLLSMQSDRFANADCGGASGAGDISCAASAVSWLTVDAFSTINPTGTFDRSGGDIPTSSVSALWSTATGQGLYHNQSKSITTVGLVDSFNYATQADSAAAWWQYPRQYWQGTPVGDSTYGSATIPNTTYQPPGADNKANALGAAPFMPCPAGSVTLTSGESTYPCFRTNSTPVVVLISNGPAHNGPNGQYSYVGEEFSGNMGSHLSAPPSPWLQGANLWPVQPASSTNPAWTGGCPTASGGALAAGAVCQATTDSSGHHGLSFTDAIQLPVATDGVTPLPGVYYGTVSNAIRGPGATGDPWYSASSVGSGVYTVNLSNTTVNNNPGYNLGYPQRNSLRDCRANDDALECTPGLSAATVKCINNTNQTTTGGVTAAPDTAGAASTANAVYANYVKGNAVSQAPANPTLATESVTSKIASTAASGGPSAMSSSAANVFALTSKAIVASTTGGSSVTATYTNGATTAPSGLQFLTLPITTTSSGGTSHLVTSIPLSAGQRLTNVTVTVVNIQAGAGSLQLQGFLQASGTSYLTTSIGAQSSSPYTNLTLSGSLYAGSAGTTANLYVNNIFPANTSTLNWEFSISYEIDTPNATPAEYAAASGGTYTGTTTWASSTPSTGATESWPTCPTNSPWNGTACSGYACPSGYILGVGGTSGTVASSLTGGSPAGSADSGMCYACTTGGTSPTTPNNSPSTTVPWTCTNTCSSGTLGNGTKTDSANMYGGANSSTSTCYSCSSGTLQTATNTFGDCSYTCGTGSLNGTTCYECNATGVWGAAINGTVNAAAGTCTVTGGCAAGTASMCTGANSGTPTMVFLSGSASTGATSTGTCEGCCAFAGDTPSPATLDTINSGTHTAATCDTCPSGWTLDTSITTNGYVCVQCPAVTGATSTLTVANTLTNECVYAYNGCDSGWTASGSNTSAICTATSACSAPTATNLQGKSGADLDGGDPTNNNASFTAPSPLCSAIGGTATSGATATGTCYTQNTTRAAGTNGTYDPGVCTFTKWSGYVAGSGGTVVPEVLASCTGTLGATYSTTMNTGNIAGECGDPSGAAAAATCATTLPDTTTCNSSYNTGYVQCTGPTNAQCTSPTGTNGGEGFFGNDIVYKFTTPTAGTGIGSRYYYHFALLAQGPDFIGTTKGWVTGGAPGGTTKLSNVTPFLYLKSASGTTMNDSTGPKDASFPYVIPASAHAADDTSIVWPGLANGPALDCNVSAYAGLWNTTDPAPASDYVLSEIDGYVPPGTYYLVVDNAMGATAATAVYTVGSSTTAAAATGGTVVLPQFQYFLQVGGFDDTPPNPTGLVQSYTNPSYNQAVAALKSINAQVIGIDNSGLSCLQAGDTITQSFDQYETRDFMDKIAFDTNSVDSTTGRTYVVSVRPDGSSCNPYVNGVAPSFSGASCTVAGYTAASAGAWCAAHYTNAPNFDPQSCTCTKSCVLANLNADCPMQTPICNPSGGGNGYCSTPSTCSALGIGGLSCAVSAAAESLTSTLKQNVYIRPISTSLTAGTTYVPPGAQCTPPTSGANTLGSGGCGPTLYCYGAPGSGTGTCTTSCVANSGCSSNICSTSTIPGDFVSGSTLRQYCIDPSVFIQSVQAVSTDAAVSTGTCVTSATCGSNSVCTAGHCYTTSPSDSLCGFPSAVACNPTHGNNDCNATPATPTCILRGPGAVACSGGNCCGVSDTGPDDISCTSTSCPNLPVYSALTAISPLTGTAGPNEPVGCSGTACGPPQYNDGMFNSCSPGASVIFNVTFKMPFQRNSAAQVYEFDLGIYAGANLIGRQRVILTNPALNAESYYRYYNASSPGICPNGTHVVWGALTYSATCPQDGANDYSQVRFCAEVGPTADAAFRLTDDGGTVVDTDSGVSNGCAPGEVLLGIASSVPTTATAAQKAVALGYTGTCALPPAVPSMGTSGAGFNVGVVLTNSGMTASEPYLRVRYELDPSQPGGAVAPNLLNWTLDFDCTPSE